MEQKLSLLFEIEDGTQEAPLIGITTYDDPMGEDKVLVVRLDKWLWAARCFKTLALARAAIEQGKVCYDGKKTIPSKEIEIGAQLVIQQGKHKRVLVIKRLLTRRRSIDESNPLFEELTPANSSAYNFDPSFERRPRRATRYLRRDSFENG